MQLLLKHSHGFEWKVTEKAIKDIESSKEVKLNYKTSESVLITFISIEESDISDIDHIIEQAGMEIKAALNDVGEIRRVLNSFLQMIDQDDSNSVIIAATNHPDILDYALFRRVDDLLR